jgi:hypothetical protein
MDTFALGVCPFDFQAFLPWAVGDSCPFNKWKDRLPLQFERDTFNTRVLIWIFHYVFLPNEKWASLIKVILPNLCLISLLDKWNHYWNIDRKYGQK